MNYRVDPIRQIRTTHPHPQSSLTQSADFRRITGTKATWWGPKFPVTSPRFLICNVWEGSRSLEVSKTKLFRRTMRTLRATLARLVGLSGQFRRGASLAIPRRTSSRDTACLPSAHSTHSSQGFHCTRIAAWNFRRLHLLDSTTYFGTALCKNVSGIVVEKIVRKFPGDFPAGFFWDFSHKHEENKNRRLNPRKHQRPTTAQKWNPWKIRSAKNPP